MARRHAWRLVVPFITTAIVLNATPAWEERERQLEDEFVPREAAARRYGSTPNTEHRSSVCDIEAFSSPMRSEIVCPSSHGHQRPYGISEP